ncbi:MAG TPA: hypothetical protein VKA06_05090, partial [Spirochaetia bacterium]|nr:hypothetical protein [Spirochaetia bacterium]
PEDPWALDVGRVAAAIADGAMRETYIRSPELHPVALDVPEGVWHGWSPFVAPVGGGSAWPDLPVGVSPFHSSDGRRVIIDVDDEGRAWIPTE